MRALFPLLLLPMVLSLLTACPPVREGGPDPGDDDDDTSPSTAVEDVYGELDAGECLASWDGDAPSWFALGEGYGTTGLWHAVDCYDAAGASINFALDQFDPSLESVTITLVSARSSAGSAAGMEAIDNDQLHLEDADWDYLGGWWEGEAELNSSDGTQWVLESLVFKELRMETVVGR